MAHRAPDALRQIVVVGAGGIGSRHVQGLRDLRGRSIVAVEPNAAAAETVRTRYAEVAHADGPTLDVVSSLDEAAAIVDPGAFVIVATNAEVRADVTQEVVERLEPAALLLEKVLFQRPEDHDRIEALVADRGIPAWVNHNMTLSDAWRSVQQRLVGVEHVRVWVSGGGWGLACNTTHYLDTFLPRDPSHPLRFDLSRLAPGSVPAKRAGYRELHGTLVATCGGIDITVTDAAGSSAPRDILIEHDQERLRVEHRSTGFSMWSASPATAWRFEHVGDHPPIIQSTLTGSVVQEIAETGTCALSTLATAGPVHRAFIEAVSSHLLASGETTWGNRCPIT